jgi:hypothetical protein
VNDACFIEQLEEWLERAAPFGLEKGLVLSYLSWWWYKVRSKVSACNGTSQKSALCRQTDVLLLYLHKLILIGELVPDCGNIWEWKVKLFSRNGTLVAAFRCSERVRDDATDVKMSSELFLKNGNSSNILVDYQTVRA